MLYHSGWIRIMLVCVVVGSLLCLKPGPGRTQSEKTFPSSRLKVATEFPNLTGEKAVEHLKQDGSYDSLAEAMAAARYSVNWVTNPRLPYLNGAYEADNPAQGFTSYFTSEGVHLVAAGEGTPAWFLAMKLQGIGYGDQLGDVSSGTPAVMNNRVELQRNSSFSILHSSFTEWYKNGPGGLEQGLTIGSPPGERSEANQLRVAFDVEGTLEARRTADGQVIHFYNRAGDQVLSYSQLVVTDAEGQKLPAQMEVDSGRVVLEIDDARAEYPVTIDPTFGQQTKLTASDGAGGDLFGFSVAISGETVVVGAPFDAIGANRNQGSAYVYVRSGTTWSQQQKLTASDGAADDFFGFSVAISGETVVVGAYLDHIGANSYQGSAYVFVRTGTTWSEQQKLMASDGAANDRFGYSVAISGETVVVGSPVDFSPNVGQGSAYVFVRNGTTWSEQQKLRAFDGAAGDNFGNAVAISGETVVVGAAYDDTGANAEQGSAYVFVRGGTTWSEQQKLTASDAMAFDQFGNSVAISGETVVVGAAYDDTGANAEQGSAYVFVRSGTTWSEQQKLTASDGAGGDEFGNSVAISGETVVVGTWRDDLGSNKDQGSASVFVRNATTWSEQHKLWGLDGDAFDEFANSVAISGETVVVGAFQDDLGAVSNQGSVSVFACPVTTRTWTQQTMHTASDGAANDWFGYSVAISGETVVVGVPHDNSYQGSAYVFVRSGTTWSQQQKLMASDWGDQFGYSVAISGETVVVGSPWGDIDFSQDQGSAYVFVRSGTTWSEQQKLTASDGQPEDFLGYSVAISGETAVIGSPWDDLGDNPNQGSAYVFVRNGTTWSEQQQLTASDGAREVQFGWSVAISGETVVAGTRFFDFVANGLQGSAYVFVRNGTTWSEQQKLTASDGAADDFFGFSVAINGETAVVGAYLDNIGANSDQGSAYVFVRSGTTWSEQQKLTASDGTANDRFGGAVAISGETVVVGAYLAYIGANTPAYVFVRNGTTWSEQQKLRAFDGVAGDNFGNSVAISGETVVVGSPWDDIVANANQGSAAVFVLGCITCPTITSTVTGGGTICAGSSATVTVTVTGGTPPYLVTLSNGGGTMIGSGPTFNFTVSPGSMTTYSFQSGTDSLLCPIAGSGIATVMVNQPPPTATAGGPQTICTNGTTAGLGGNVPSVGAGSWSVVSGGSGIFSPNASTPNATFTHTGGTGPITVRWTVSNVLCGDTTADVVITVNRATTVNAGPDQNICHDNPVVTLAASFGGGAGSGTWTGGAGTFTPDNTTPNATYTLTAGEIAAGTVTLTYTTNDPAGPCSASSDSLTITIGLCVGLMVADTTNNRIQVFEGTTWKVIGVGTVGTGNGQFRLPEAVAFDRAGRIYVADTGNNRIQWSTNSGATWANFATNGTATTQVKAPQGLALDSTGNLYVSDTGNGRVMRFNGGIPGSGVVIASKGTASNQVSSPRGLVIDATFRLFVTDESNSRVLRILNANTTVSATSGTTLASSGTGMNQVKNPQGITIDATGTVFVADTGNSRILRWANASPANASTMALIGSGLGQVNRPEGVTVITFTTGALAGTPLLIVGDTSNNRIAGRPTGTGGWLLIGTPNNIGTGVGQFRAPSKIQ